ncbi:MAG: class I SAM-dependent methyltransferase [candidate division KSB1 bacterium]|nr:class I SAM-dependent methyltransferase [candidate division KSB1 bacterium]MDZ7358210.1 class I SAM-dependent methyltransferase [candidate division KSB1 bacterium]MDZ7376148.1 class I SAM-dependent methyltransferase [candidate division KSB1 bacterium]
MIQILVEQNAPEIRQLLELLTKIPEPMCSSPQPEFLYALAKSVPADGTIVEIGTCAGKSLISMAMARRAINGTPVHSIDIEKHPLIDNYIDAAGVRDWTDLIIGESTKVAQHWSHPIDLLFIDGDHRYIGVKRDILAWQKWVKMNGMVAFHDYGDGTGVPRAIHKKILNRPWMWQVISDREYGSIFVIKRLIPALEDRESKWHEQNLWWFYFRKKISKNILIQKLCRFIQNQIDIKKWNSILLS